jgi:hypothetical protein
VVEFIQHTGSGFPHPSHHYRCLRLLRHVLDVVLKSVSGPALRLSHSIVRWSLLQYLHRQHNDTAVMTGCTRLSTITLHFFLSAMSASLPSISSPGPLTRSLRFHHNFAQTGSAATSSRGGPPCMSFPYVLRSPNGFCALTIFSFFRTSNPSPNLQRHTVEGT